MIPDDADERQRTKYRLESTSSAAREFRKLPENIRQQLVPAIDGLALESRPAGCIKLAGAGNYLAFVSGTIASFIELKMTHFSLSSLKSRIGAMFIARKINSCSK